MNLYIRLISMWISTLFKSRVSLLDEFRSRHRVLPGDLDPLGHMNNSRYFAFGDLARIEMLTRAGGWRVFRRRKLHPVLAGETIQFRKALMPFERFEMRTRLAAWDHRFFYVEHRFMRGEEICALALIKFWIVGSARPAPAEFMRMLGLEVEDTRGLDIVERWNESSDEHWARR